MNPESIPSPAARIERIRSSTEASHAVFALVLSSSFLAPVTAADALERVRGAFTAALTTELGSPSELEFSVSVAAGQAGAFAAGAHRALIARAARDGFLDTEPFAAARSAYDRAMRFAVRSRLRRLAAFLRDSREVEPAPSWGARIEGYLAGTIFVAREIGVTPAYLDRIQAIARGDR